MKFLFEKRCMDFLVSGNILSEVHPCFSSSGFSLRKGDDFDSV